MAQLPPTHLSSLPFQNGVAVTRLSGMEPGVSERPSCAHALTLWDPGVRMLVRAQAIKQHTQSLAYFVH